MDTLVNCISAMSSGTFVTKKNFLWIQKIANRSKSPRSSQNDVYLKLKCLLKNSLKVLTNSLKSIKCKIENS